MHVLLVEDNEGDILLTVSSLEDCHFVNKITVIKDGKKAIRFFEKLNDAEHVPNLVLLDINLPQRTGHEVLQFIKKSENYNQLPVIMLTASTSERDMLLSYKHYADYYLTKPIDLDEFVDALKKIGIIKK